MPLENEIVKREFLSMLEDKNKKVYFKLVNSLRLLN